MAVYLVLIFVGLWGSTCSALTLLFRFCRNKYIELGAFIKTRCSVSDVI